MGPKQKIQKSKAQEKSSTERVPPSARRTRSNTRVTQVVLTKDLGERKTQKTSEKTQKKQNVAKHSGNSSTNDLAEEANKTKSRKKTTHPKLKKENSERKSTSKSSRKRKLEYGTEKTSSNFKLVDGNKQPTENGNESRNPKVPKVKASTGPRVSRMDESNEQKAESDEFQNEAFDSIQKFDRYYIGLSKDILSDERFTRSSNHFTLNVVSNHLHFQNVKLLEYLDEICSIHSKIFDSQRDIKKLSLGMAYSDLNIHEWTKRSKKCWFAEPQNYSMDVKNVPPFLIYTFQMLEFFWRIISKFIVSDLEVEAIFFKRMYQKSIVKKVGKLCLKLLLIWNNMEDTDRKPSMLMNWALRVFSKVLDYELRKSGAFPTSVKEESLLLSLFVNKNIVQRKRDNFVGSLDQFVDICFKYIGTTDKHKTGRKESRENLMCFSEMIQTYCISVVPPIKEEGSAVHSAWEKVSQIDIIIPKLLQKELFWSGIVKQQLQRALLSPIKIHRSFTEMEFGTSLLMQPSFIEDILSESRSNIKDYIYDVIVRIIAEISKDPLPIFSELLEQKIYLRNEITALDFFQSFQKLDYLRHDLLQTRRQEIMEIMREMIQNAAKLGWLSIDREDVNKFWQYGGFINNGNSEPLENVPLESDSDGSHLPAHELLSRKFMFSSIAGIIACLGIFSDAGEGSYGLENPISSVLKKISSARSCIMFLEAILIIQYHSERHLIVPVDMDEDRNHSGAKRNMNPKEKPKKHERYELLSAKDQNKFSLVVEAVRCRVCDLKGVNTFHGLEDQRGGPKRIDGATNRSKSIGLDLPHITTIAPVQKAVVSNKGYIDLEDDVQFMESISKFGIFHAEQDILRIQQGDSEKVKWTILQRNEYVDDARDHLSEEEEAVGEMCSCVLISTTPIGSKAYKKGLSKEKFKSTTEGRSIIEQNIGCADNKCENRMTRVECGPGPCGVGGNCQNRRLQNMEYPKTAKFQVPGKGAGLRPLEDITAGTLIGEYQGEVITMEEYERRNNHYKGERHYYFMKLTKKLVIDASRKGQTVRYINHSCDPNCDAEQWNAGGEPRIAIVANQAIKKGEELSFDYGGMAIGNDASSCLCGSEKCRGKMKASESKTQRTPKKKNKTKDASSRVSKKPRLEDVAFSAETQEEAKALKQKVDKSVAKSKLRIIQCKEIMSALKNQSNQSGFQETELCNREQEALDRWKKQLGKKR